MDHRQRVTELLAELRSGVSYRHTKLECMAADAIDQLLDELDEARKCCSQRGARLQIMRDWMMNPETIIWPGETMWEAFAETRSTEDWFDEDGVPR